MTRGRTGPEPPGRMFLALLQGGVDNDLDRRGHARSGRAEAKMHIPHGGISMAPYGSQVFFPKRGASIRKALRANFGKARLVYFIFCGSSLSSRRSAFFEETL